MAVTADDVRHVAALARVGVPDSRIPALVHELNDILGHFDALQAVNLPAESDEDLENAGMPLREDGALPVRLEHPRESFAPLMRDGFFLVPRLETHSATNETSSDAEEES